MKDADGKRKERNIGVNVIYMQREREREREVGYCSSERSCTPINSEEMREIKPLSLAFSATRPRD